MDVLRTSTGAFSRKERVPKIDSIEVKSDTSALEEIGSGARARVTRVMRDGRFVAVKKFKEPGGAASAAQGYEFLARNLSEKEREHLIKDFGVNTDDNSVVMELLNQDKWVLSMGKNESRDRTELRDNKLKTIPNFASFATQLFDAVEEAGDKGVAIGPDVYFFTVDRKSRKIDYVYADTETAAARPQFSLDAVPAMNIYWAAGALNHFLHECVERPEMYLDRVKLEAQSRLWMAPNNTQKDRERLSADFEWPTLGWRKTIASKASWIGGVIKRRITGVMSE